ncbi:asparagine synthase (glutamine-hydrolyzing) [Mariprofundus erugo]|uniref:asparagine synthase (glutamine-hydrolyzing) n=1 Tax=Mariprofundus erugo TaxID=2528639 RepID=UPI0010FCEB32|nr:asparagine synthase (glutamine-hydrolyzing) [Mariprofundus erugo]TLS76035.1 asparagine synthase (glutamine-hydrolyzing) [Mariprofundus erugo]
MCGIFGVALAGRSDFQLATYIDLLNHRGPDDHGWLVWDRESGTHKGRQHDHPAGNLFLGHTRLSILDLSQEGWQPMSSDDGRFHIVFNGEIYNYQELREELKALGRRFHSHSDTEVLLQACMQWGQKALPKLIGMFAFAFFNSESGTLMLARDHFGIKPLFFSRWKGGFAFASEIAPLLRLPDVSKLLNVNRTYEYLQFGSSDYGCETMLRDIEQLPAAHSMQINLADVSITSPQAYWQLDCSRNLDISFEEASQRLRSLFLDSVALHLRSDVPVGAALSGGIDSSAIVCAIRHLQPDSEIHAFTYVAEDEALSEKSWAGIVARHVDATMHCVEPAAADLVHDMDRLISTQGEPFGSSSIYAQNRVFQLASEAGIKVMLDGQGADEMLAGYPGYAGCRLASQLKHGQLLQAWRFLQHVGRLPGRRRIDTVNKAIGYFIPSHWQGFARRLANRELLSDWLDAGWLQQAGVQPHVPNWQPSGRDCLRHELANSLLQVAIPGLLRYEDRNSMAHSIESRVPFLNWPLVEFVFSLPEHYLLDAQGQTKAVFRAAMRGIVPDAILDRQDKIGFTTPEKAWLQANPNWLQATLAHADTLPMFHAGALQALWRDIDSGQRRFDFQLWRCLNFIRWTQLYGIDGIAV